RCSDGGASVSVDGAILMVNDLQRWADQCEALYRDMTCEALLSSYEPNLKAAIRPSDDIGHLTLRVEITPEHMAQDHRFDMALDQSFLPALIHQCREVVMNYPIRDPEKWHRA